MSIYVIPMVKIRPTLPLLKVGIRKTPWHRSLNNVELIFIIEIRNTCDESQMNLDQDI
jgi:hypothetical protein